MTKRGYQHARPDRRAAFDGRALTPALYRDVLRASPAPITRIAASAGYEPCLLYRVARGATPRLSLAVDTLNALGFDVVIKLREEGGDDV